MPHSTLRLVTFSASSGVEVSEDRSVDASVSSEVDSEGSGVDSDDSDEVSNFSLISSWVGASWVVGPTSELGFSLVSSDWSGIIESSESLLSSRITVEMFVSVTGFVSSSSDGLPGLSTTDNLESSLPAWSVFVWQIDGGLGGVVFINRSDWQLDSSFSWPSSDCADMWSSDVEISSSTFKSLSSHISSISSILRDEDSFSSSNKCVEKEEFSSSGVVKETSIRETPCLSSLHRDSSTSCRSWLQREIFWLEKYIFSCLSWLVRDNFSCISSVRSSSSPLSRKGINSVFSSFSRFSKLPSSLSYSKSSDSVRVPLVVVMDSRLRSLCSMSRFWDAFFTGRSLVLWSLGNSSFVSCSLAKSSLAKSSLAKSSLSKSSLAKSSLAKSSLDLCSSANFSSANFSLAFCSLSNCSFASISLARSSCSLAIRSFASFSLANWSFTVRSLVLWSLDSCLVLSVGWLVATASVFKLLEVTNFKFI